MEKIMEIAMTDYTGTRIRIKSFKPSYQKPVHTENLHFNLNPEARQILKIWDDPKHLMPLNSSIIEYQVNAGFLAYSSNIFLDLPNTQ